jgi:ABC-type cobalamin/Fe3+-siderophores transport system ATPase subunit
VLLLQVGPEGCGKSTLLDYCFSRLPGRVTVATVHCSAQTSADTVIQKLLQVRIPCLAASVVMQMLPCCFVAVVQRCSLWCAVNPAATRPSMQQPIAIRSALLMSNSMSKTAAVVACHVVHTTCCRCAASL